MALLEGNTPTSGAVVRTPPKPPQRNTRAAAPRSPNTGYPAPSPPISVPSVSPGSIPSITQPSPKPAKPPSLKDFLAGDAAYQQAIRGGQRTLQDFLSELTRRRGESQTQFGQTKEQMELDRQRKLEQMRQEFASRGLIHSGLFGREQGRFQEDFNTQLSQLEQQFASLMQDLTGEKTSMKRQHELALEQARQEAIARRAARHNL